jgi:hypothetical protein
MKGVLHYLCGSGIMYSEHNKHKNANHPVQFREKYTPANSIRRMNNEREASPYMLGCMDVANQP